MSKPTRTVDKFATLTGLARRLGVPKSTLNSAVVAGHVATAELGCGETILEIESARKWAASDRTPGRKRNCK